MSGAFYTNNLKSEVISRFQKCETIGKFASLLNYIEKKTNPEISNVKKITGRTLTHLSLTTEIRYKEFKLKKKGGGERLILAPDNHLVRIQGLINILFQILFENRFHYNSNGFILNRNILRNAQPHVNKNYVLNLDLKDFFPSIGFRRIKTVFELEPLNLVSEKESIGFYLANICCYKGILPQGAPTSPIISNMVTQRLDRRISKYCSSKKVKYSRYADDLSFSSNQAIFDKKFIAGITKIIQSENFNVNKEKTRLRTSMDRQLVTGIVVNEKPNVNREYIKKVRTILKNWEAGGEKYAQKIFILKYDRQCIFRLKVYTLFRAKFTPHSGIKFTPHSG
jgi:retron-type reverse transcriptase